MTLGRRDTDDEDSDLRGSAWGDGMITSLMAGTAVPSWDTALVRALNDAVAGIWNESEIWHFEVMNDEGEAYRRLVVEGPAQHSKILECLHGRGFHVVSTPRGLLIRRTGVAFP